MEADLAAEATTAFEVPEGTEQQIRFCDVRGARVAVACVGRGPPLVLPAWWVSHLETDWRSPAFRSWVESLARARTVIRYDRLGTGLSDRSRRPADMTLDAEVEVVGQVLDELGIESCDMLGVSCGCCSAAAFAARRPDRVRRLVMYSAYADGSALAPPDVRESIVSMVRAHWGLGSRVMAELFLSDAKPPERREFADLQRASASAPMAAELLDLVYRFDVRDALPRIVAPTLVIHRREDRAVRMRLGREVAALIPGARFMALDGRAHLPWHGASPAVTESLLRFLEAAPDTQETARGPAEALSARETEVLKLVAGGLSDREVAQALFLSPHTVHRHVANIRAKLGQPNRAAAAAEALRLQLI